MTAFTPKISDSVFWRETTIHVWYAPHDFSEMPKSYLTLGWKVTPTLDPEYWVGGEAKIGAQPDDALVKVAAGDVGAHTAIIAQSGSGKSFFLGRFIEELLLNTKSTCIVLDSNADFRRVFEVEDKSVWEEAKYDPKSRSGKLPHEATRADFEGQWSKVPIRILRGDIQKGEQPPDTRYRGLSLNWPDIEIDFLIPDLDAALRGAVYHCHAFVQALAPLLRQKAKAEKTEIDLISFSEEALEKEQKYGDGIGLARALGKFAEIPSQEIQDPLKLATTSDPLDRVKMAVKYISPEGKLLYFGKAREYQAAGILNTKLPREVDKTRVALEVIDLPSIPDRATRLLAINALLATRWNTARIAWSKALEKPAAEDKRAPTFVVVDEAHNWIPAHPDNKTDLKLREQFRTIVSEGRKYGLFLVVVTQRPDKLDPQLLSECENKAIMKLSSSSVLELTQKALGLEDVSSKELRKCLEFNVGRVALAGNWAPEGLRFCYAAARRTVEGGRSLQKKHWAEPYTKHSPGGTPAQNGDAKPSAKAQKA